MSDQEIRKEEEMEEEQEEKEISTSEGGNTVCIEESESSGT